MKAIDKVQAAAAAESGRVVDIGNRQQDAECDMCGNHDAPYLHQHNMPVETIDHALQTIKANGLQNVLDLRGDPPHGQDKFVQVEGGFACARDLRWSLLLVKHIKAKYGDYFGITVAGYPDMIGNDGVATPESYQNDLAYLKSKVDAGADLIITQLFYDTDIFLKNVNDCRQMGINCPIVPRITPIN